jgi:hypothetical protein
MPKGVRIWRQVGGALTALGGDIGEPSTAPVLCVQRSLPLGAELADPTLFQPQRLQSIHGAVIVNFWALVFVYRARPSFSSVIPHLITILGQCRVEGALVGKSGDPPSLQGLDC